MTGGVLRGKRHHPLVDAQTGGQGEREQLGAQNAHNFTDGSGKAGKYSVAHLRALGHHVVNADQVSSGYTGPELILDITDSGQVIGAMSQFVDFHELDTGTGVPKYDAVMHFAATPRVMIGTDAEVFRIDTLSTYNVI